MEWLIGDAESREFYLNAYNPGTNFNDRTYNMAITGGGYLFRDVAPPSTTPPECPSTYKRCARVFTYSWIAGGVSGGDPPTPRAVYSLPRLEPVSSFYHPSQAVISSILTHFGLTPGGGTGVLAIYVVWMGWRVVGAFSVTPPRYPKTYPLTGESNSIGIALAARYRAQS